MKITPKTFAGTTRYYPWVTYLDFDDVVAEPVAWLLGVEFWVLKHNTQQT
jgi:hypothetical protein